jgi:beta-fructofuranosidase
VPDETERPSTCRALLDRAVNAGVRVEQRPAFHLLPAHGWANDPIGPIRWGGRYHLFQQHNPHAAVWARPHWGHFVSDDLVSWERMPVALSPSDDGADADGCFSGSVVADGDTAAMLYTGVRGAPGPDQRQATCLARSSDPDLRMWQRDPGNPVTCAPPGYDLIGFRDPFVWRHDGAWLQLVGAGRADAGGILFLFESRDLRTWRPLGPALRAENLPTGLWAGTMWECPALLPFEEDLSLLVLSLHDGTTTHYPVALVGSFDGRRFTPRSVQRMDFGREYYAPCVLRDEHHGSVCWGWAWEARTEAAQRAAGWAGVLTLPRVLSARPDGVGVEPLPGLERLRVRRLPVRRTAVADGWRAGGAEGDRLEIYLELPPQPAAVGLRVRCSPDHAERTTITYERSAGRLRIDRERASLDPEAFGGVQDSELRLGDDEPLRLRVFVDRSITEVYANGRVVATVRTYPTRPDSLGVEVFAGHGQPLVSRCEVWEMGAVTAEAPG